MIVKCCIHTVKYKSLTAVYPRYLGSGGHGSSSAVLDPSAFVIHEALTALLRGAHCSSHPPTPRAKMHLVPPLCSPRRPSDAPAHSLVVDGGPHAGSRASTTRRRVWTVRTSCSYLHCVISHPASPMGTPPRAQVANKATSSPRPTRLRFTMMPRCFDNMLSR